MSSRAPAAPARPGGGIALTWIAAVLAFVYAVYGASAVIINRDAINSLLLRYLAVTDQSDATLDKWFRIGVYGSVLLLGLIGLLLFMQRPRVGATGRTTALAFPSGLGAVALLMAIACVFGVGVVSHKFLPGAHTGLFLTGTFLVLLQVTSEEVMFRGMLLPVLTRATGPLIAIPLSALGFAGVHYAGGWSNPISLFNIFLAGTWFALLAYRTGGLLAPILAHFAYNWTEEMLFGASPNPGIGSFGSVVDVELSGAAIWGGSAEGLNASVVLTLVLALLIAAQLRRPRVMLKSPELA
jgi:uncharacterized protein